LTDGYPPGATAQAAAAKAAGIKVYIAAFNNWNQGFNDKSVDLSTCTLNLCNSLRGICSWSSDNGDLNTCFNNINADNSTNSSFSGYTYYVGNKSGVEPINPPTAAVVSSRLTFIMDNVVKEILTRIPQNITYSIGGGNPVSLASFTGATFAIPASAVKCDISGASGCNPNHVIIKVNFNGSGQIELNNFSLNVLPLCQSE